MRRVIAEATSAAVLFGFFSVILMWGTAFAA